MNIITFPFGCTDKGITYSYHKRGMETPLPPCKTGEDYQRDEYSFESGNLFAGKEVAWKGSAVLDSAVDIKFNLPQKIFADHVKLCLGKGSEAAKIEVFDEKLCSIGSFVPQSGSAITDSEITVALGARCEALTIRIHFVYMDLSIEKLEIKACTLIEDEPYPLCKNIEYRQGYFQLSKACIKAENADEKFAAAHFCDRVKEKLGINLDCKADGNIALETGRLQSEEYSIDVTESGVRVNAGSRRALLYACEALLTMAGNDGELSVCHITDSPFMKLRGIHLALPSRKDMDFLKSLVRNVLVPMRYNTVFLQLTAAMRYDRFPEINEAWLKICREYEAGKAPKPGHYDFVGHDIIEKEEVKELCAYMRSYGLEIIPEVQCFSHSQYITCAFPDMAERAAAGNEEVDLYIADEKIADYYPPNLCPLHPRYYEVVFGIIDEVIEATAPERYIHMGHDELYDIGNCPKCRKRDVADLFAEEVTNLHDYLKSKGLGMMMWSDMLHEKQYKTIYAINKIPKDIVMLDFTWYFHLNENIEEELLQKDFKVILGNMYSSHFPRYSQRSKADGIIGAEVSTWVGCNELSYGYEGKLYDLVYSANMMWNDSYHDDMRLSYAEMIKPPVWNIRKTIGALKTDGEKIKIDLDGSEGAIPTRIRACSGFEKAVRVSAQSESISFEADTIAETICVTHATDRPGERIMWQEPVKLGSYVVEYEDGTSIEEAILYGYNIGRYDAGYGSPIASPLFRHQGYTATYTAKPKCGKDCDGNDFTLYEHYIKNTCKDKKIKKVTLRHSKISDAEIILFDMTIIK